MTQKKHLAARFLLRSKIFSMRIFARLLLGHTIPVACVSVALALTLMALMRMTGVLQNVTDKEMHTLQLESDVHHASWLVDIAIGTGFHSCSAGANVEESFTRIEQSADDLRLSLQSSPELNSGLADMGARWLQLAERVTSSRSCELLGSTQLRSERDQLDDQLTDLWSRRLSQLHAAVAEKDEEARAIGRSAVRTGGVLAILSFFLAMLMARHLAKTFNIPLARLSVSARRVGAGDFNSKIAVEGPMELRNLAAEFERMRLQLAQIEQLKQEFLASVSHELRTPLSKLREALAILSDGVVGELSAEQSRVVQIARAACEREIRMVTTLLDLSRLRAGSPIRPRVGRMIDQVVEAAVQEELAETTERDVEVLMSFEGPVPLCRLDPILLERSIANLVRNAISVSQDGQKVHVYRRPVKRENKEWIRVSVVDEGPGVPVEIRETVFSPFVTSLVQKSPKALGVGLGLALAREVAVAHGGELELDLSVAQGATFHLFLPIFREGELSPAKKEEARAN